MSDCRGERTTVSPAVARAAMSAGSWKVMDLPPPVGKIASNDSPATADAAAASCSDSLSPS